jgi:hypothetical protein
VLTAARFNSVRSYCVPGSVVSSRALSASEAMKRGSVAPSLEQTSNATVKTSSYIRLFMLLTLGNVFPSEAIGRIV